MSLSTGRNSTHLLIFVPFEGKPRSLLTDNPELPLLFKTTNGISYKLYSRYHTVSTLRKIDIIIVCI